MTTRDEPWPQGTPCWVDLMVPDAPAAQRFYAELFGWRMRESAEEAGGYAVAELHGRAVAGLGPTPPDTDVPPVWTTYLAVDDVDAAVEQVTRAGGQVFTAPIDVMDQGRMAVAADPTGAVFGLWQAKAHTGAGVVNEPGALTWNECMSRDYERARAFYTQVFGYDLQDVDDPAGQRYCVLGLGGRPVGGLGEIEPGSSEVPAEVPAYWMSYFAVGDTDATLQQATGLGARVLVPPQDTPYGRMAVLEGSQGEPFAVIAG